jgi:hypothetical protein
MTPAQQKEPGLLWLIRPEDSSSWEAETLRPFSKHRHPQRVVLSVAKFLLCYATALATAVLLSGLH